MLRETLYFEDTVFRFESAALFRNFQRDGIVKDLVEMARALAKREEAKSLIEKYYGWVSNLVRKGEEQGFSGNVFGMHVISLFMEDENPFSLACERGQNVADTSVYRLALREMEILRYFIDFDVQNICDNVGFGEDMARFAPVRPREHPVVSQIESMQSPAEMLRQLMWYYKNAGCGRLAAHSMFVLGGASGAEAPARLTGVKNADRVTLSDIIGYETQKSALRRNTEAFLAGCPANNILLAGPGGTGKSSCVKALANEYYEQGLKLIEADPCNIYMLKDILADLGGRGKRFIVFIDDLSFEAPDENYFTMKSMLEGNASVCPPNVLFYATSNRRHLVRELWSDRARAEGEDQDDVHATDTVSEKLSLSDRFGVTLFFSRPAPDQYLEIVQGIAAKENLAVPADFLREQAMQWEVSRKGRSGRTARQFINNVLGEMSELRI